MSKLITVLRYLTNPYPALNVKTVFSNYWGALMILPLNPFVQFKMFNEKRQSDPSLHVRRHIFEGSRRVE